MRILFFTHYSSLYGANLSMLGLAEYLIKDYGFKVYIVCPKEGELIKAAREIGAVTRCFRYFSWQCFNRFWINKLLRNIINPFLLARVIFYTKRISPDIIHNNTSVTDLGIKVASKLNIPCVWHLREYGKEDYEMDYLVSKKEIIKNYSAATALISVSDSLRSAFTNKYPMLEIETIYNGIKPFEVKKIDHKGCNFCIIGKITEKKGQYEILKAVNVLVQKKRRGFHVFFAGEGDYKYINKLKEYVANEKIDEFVTFSGYVRDIIDYLSYMDVGIMASENEAFGRVTVEYMMAEMRVIAMDSGGTREIIGDYALYYDSDNNVSLADQMEYCIDNAYDKGAEVRQIAINKFNQKKCVDKIVNIYSKVKNRGM